MALPDRCPLCSAGRESQSVVTRHVYGDASASRAFFHCAACDVRYQFPGLTPDEEARFYAAEFEGFMASRSGESGGWLKTEQHLVANEPTRMRRMKYLAPYLEASVDILEVGCSSGFMLYPLADAGHRCTGIEPSLQFLLTRLGESSEVLRDQRYDLSNHMIWARDGRPGGMGRFTPELGADVEASYKQSLIRSGKCDTLVGIIRKDGGA